jgi:hypothetical protein
VTFASGIPPPASVTRPATRPPRARAKSIPAVVAVPVTVMGVPDVTVQLPAQRKLSKSSST